MDRFECAYRDQKSPLALTPFASKKSPLDPFASKKSTLTLTPLASNSPFDFNFGGDNTLQNTIDSIKRALTPTQCQSIRYSEDLPRDNNCLEVKTTNTCEVKIQITTTTTTSFEKTPKQSLEAQQRRLPFGQHQPLAASPSYLDFNNNVSVSASSQQKQEVTLKKEQKKVLKKKKCKSVKKDKLSVRMGRSMKSYVKSSPIQPRPLSPRISKLLSTVGQQKHKVLFQREEIDLSVFRRLKENDLVKMGIHSAEDRIALMRAGKNAYQV